MAIGVCGSRCCVDRRLVGRRGAGDGNRRGQRQRRNGKAVSGALAPRRRHWFAVLRQDALDATADGARPRHGDGAVHRSRSAGHVEQDRRVAGAVVERLHRGVVADHFGKAGEAAVQPPRQRIEPEQGAVELGQQQQIEIAAGHVGPLVRQYRPLRGCGPADAVVRQHDAAAHRHRRGDRRTGANPAACRPGVADGPRRAQELPGQDDTHRQANQHRAGHHEITGHQPEPPGWFAEVPAPRPQASRR